MFQSAYQDGDCVEVFSPAGKNPAAEWKLGGKVVRLYEKGVKGYVLAVSGGATSKMQLPKAPKGQLGLRQRHLVLQVQTAKSQDKPFSLELGLTDTAGTRRRLVLSSSFRVLHCTPLHAQIPLDGLDRHRGSWANLSVDLAGLTALCFRADAYRTLDYIAINPTCRLRKVFTMKGTLHDDALQESGEGDDRNEHIAASLSGLNGAPASAPLAPVPIRVAFPAGVVPTPRNWVISVHTLQRVAYRNGPPPSPSHGSASTTAFTKKGFKAHQTTSPRQISLTRSPASPSPTAAIMHLSVEARGMSPRTSGSAEKRRSPPPRLHDKLISTPSSHLGSRGSPGGILQPRRSLSSRGSSSSSTRTPVTPSPQGTPARTSSSAVRCRGPPQPSSASSSTLEAPASERNSRAGGVAVGPVGSRGMAMRSEIVGSPALLGRNPMDAIPSFRGTPWHATRGQAKTPGSATGGVFSPTESGHGDQLRGKGSRGILPARQRASAASHSADRIRNMGGQTAIAGNSSESGAGINRGGRMTGMSEDDWQGASHWNGGQMKLAPAWSFVGESLAQGTSQGVEPRPESSSCEGNPSALPPEERAVAASRNSAFIGESETHGVAGILAQEGIQGKGGGRRLCVEAVPSALPTTSETFPDEDGVDWRELQNRQSDGAVVSLQRFAAAASLRSSKGNNAFISDASPQSCRLASAPAPIAVSAAAGISAGIGTFERSFPDPIVAKPTKGDKTTNESTISTPIPTSPFSPTVDETSTARRSLALSENDSRSSDRETTVRSPMSARFDVLQSLLAPSVMGDQDVRPEHERLLRPAEVRSTESEVRLGRKERTDGGGHSNGVSGAHAGENDVLEGLTMVHSAIISGPSSSSRSSICGDTGRGNTNGICRIVNDIPRRGRDRPTFSVGGGSNDKKIGDSSDRPRTSGTVAKASQSIRARQSPIRVQVGNNIVGLKHESGGQTDSASADNDRVTVNGIGTGVGEEGRPALSSPDHTEDFLQLPSFLTRSENERLGAEGKMPVDRSELDEIRRKEIALLDLEESFHSEFGSVDLSLSPEVGFSAKDLSQAKMPPVENHVEADPRTATKSLPRRRCHAQCSDTKNVLSSESRRYRQQAGACDDDRNEDIDVDSVVLGSRDSAGSQGLREEDKAEGKCRQDSLPAAGEDRGVREKTSSRRRKEEERVPSQTEEPASDLCFDPVLNCYYDRVADKYYGLR